MRKLVFMLVFFLLTVFASHANAASVYIATNSRTYHCDRNCPELNTDNVIEFNSPEEADALGAIPCGHCKLTTGKLNYNINNVLLNPVITNGSLGEFRHGTFPSPPLGDFTHVGVDLIAPCGSNVYTFADGRVKDVIDNTNDKDYKTLGYMVLIEHPASLTGKKFYTLYLHMQGPPEVKIGNQVTGGSTVIGKVGDTGKAFGCHTHFEIRYFPERFSTWGNIYGPGDQRASEYFKQNWGNPLTFFQKYPNGLKIVKSNEAENNTGKVETKNETLLDKEAFGFANTIINQHWLIVEKSRKDDNYDNSLFTIFRGVLIQMKDVIYKVEIQEVNEVDKMNGIEWKGYFYIYPKFARKRRGVFALGNGHNRYECRLCGDKYRDGHTTFKTSDSTWSKWYAGDAGFPLGSIGESEGLTQIYRYEICKTDGKWTFKEVLVKGPSVSGWGYVGDLKKPKMEELP
jgi:murein DD-endopeptidase MepM/ murein hydrolase activator NlpD